MPPPWRGMYLIRVTRTNGYKKSRCSAGSFLIIIAFSVVRVQKLMRNMAVGFAKEIPVDSDHIRILVRFAESHMLIFRVDGFHPVFSDLHACRNRLSAASDASTRTSHYLNKMIR